MAALGFVSSDVVYGYDEDWTYDGFHPYGYSSTDYYDRDVETTTADLRWVSKPADANAMDWVLGLYLLDRETCSEPILGWTATLSARFRFSDRRSMVSSVCL